MLKVFYLFLLFTAFIEARMVGGVALVVDGEPITTNEIKRVQSSGVSKEDAIEILIRQKLEENAIKRAGIFINDLDIDNAITAIAQRNGMDVESFKRELAKQGIDYQTYRKKIAKDMMREKLYRKISQGRVKKPTEDELKSYYKRDKKRFIVPGSIEVTEYSSNDGKPLQLIQAAPLMRQEGVKTREIKIDPLKVNPKLVELLQKTKENSFTPIINTGKGFVMFYVKKKNPPKTLPFDKVKKDIFAMMMKEREDAVLVEFFEKAKAEAYIKVVRKP
jgi:parvulin-like peptidyl-prolyl isomerase